jgi:hypothetical protein
MEVRGAKTKTLDSVLFLKASLFGGARGAKAKNT